jgi:hypothetical protein
MAIKDRASAVEFDADHDQQQQGGAHYQEDGGKDHIKNSFPA